MKIIGLPGKRKMKIIECPYICIGFILFLPILLLRFPMNLGIEKALHFVLFYIWFKSPKGLNNQHFEMGQG